MNNWGDFGQWNNSNGTFFEWFNWGDNGQWNSSNGTTGQWNNGEEIPTDYPTNQPGY